MKFIILSLLLTQFFAVNCLSQTRITTKSGNTFIGFIQFDNDNEIVLLRDCKEITWLYPRIFVLLHYEKRQCRINS